MRSLSDNIKCILHDVVPTREEERVGWVVDRERMRS
jgi:hypothetical protein